MSDWRPVFNPDGSIDPPPGYREAVARNEAERDELIGMMEVDLESMSPLAAKAWRQLKAGVITAAEFKMRLREVVGR